MKKLRNTLRTGKSTKGLIISGAASFNARNVVVGDNASIVDKSGAEQKRDEVVNLITDIEQQLSGLPKELAETRSNIEAFTAALKQEAQKESPNKSLWKVTGTGLIDAVKSVASIAPNLLSTAKSVAAFFS